MIKNKIYKTSLFFLGMILLFSCSKEDLNLSPKSSIGDNAFYTDEEEVLGAVIAIYDGLQNVPLREFALTEMRSDNTRSNSSEGDWGQFERFDVQPTNLATGQYWTDNYNVIFRSNRVIENLDVVEDQSARSQFEGEAKFTRALAHFNLVRAYGDVPLLDRVIIQTDTDYFDRDAVNDVLAFIASDLSEAMSLLPSQSESYFGRATSGAAAALLAKVYLTQGNYSGAETLLNQIIESNEYTLVDEYNDIFYNEQNSEIIFAIPYLDDDANESQDFSFEMTIGGVRSGLNFLTDDFNAAMDPMDLERLPVLVDALDPRATGKYLTSSSNARLCGNDWIVLRLADVLLMHAEAIMAGNDATNDLDAIISYNAIRTRVGLSTLALDGSATLTQQMLLDERRMELAFENHRLYDLIRFGVAEAVLGAFATSEGYNFSATDLLLPIPQGEINVSQGLLEQNPGY